MITECVQHPLIYDIDNLNNDRFQILIIHLNQLVRNGVLVIDEEAQFINILNEYINKLPGDKRMQLSKSFGVMKSRNRIKKICINDMNSKNICKVKYCDKFYSIINDKVENCVVNNRCISKMKSNSTTKFYSLNDYSTSELYNRLEEIIKSVDKETSIGYFNDEIIKPLIKYTSSFKVYDKVFANSMVENGAGADVKDNFKRGIEFLLDTIKNNNVNKDFTFEIYTSIYDGFNNRKFKQVKDSLTKYITSLRSIYPFNINIYVKDKFSDFPHSRHFITEQVGVTVDKGLDLLNSDNKLNDNIFTIMNEIDIAKKERCRSFKNIIKI